MHMEVRQEALVTPTRCINCMDHQGPFADAGIEIPGYGHVYTCARCVFDMGRLFGMVDPDQALQMQGLLDEVRAHVLTLEQERDAAADLRTMKVSDMRKVVAEAVATTPAQPLEETTVATVTRGRKGRR